jgi:hypothetical protein
LVDLIVLQTVSYLIAALSFAVTCAYYIMNLKNTQRNMQLTLESRNTQIFLQLMNYLKAETGHWTQFMLTYEWSDFDDYMNKYGPTGNPEAWDEQSKHLTTFEGLGILIDKKMIDLSLVYEAYGDWVLRYWEKFQPVVVKFRKTYGPEFLEWTEYLVSELRKYRLVKYGPDPASHHPELKV